MTSTPHTGPLHLAVALNGAGWHPAANPPATDGAVLTARYWREQVRLAEEAGADLVTLDDTFGPPADVAGRRRPRLDAHVLAASLATVTSRIGLVPTITTTHTEPYHVAIRTATLDHASRGRSGWQPRVSLSPADARLTGLREAPDLTGLDRAELVASAAVQEVFDEAAAVVETVRDTWDSWEDDAVIRDVATGRFLDADRLHRVEAEHRWFSVAGPSVVPRPPQGQPPVVALAHATVPYLFAARAADVVVVTPFDIDHAARIVAEVRQAEAEAGRSGEPLRILADLVVVLGEDRRAAVTRLGELEAAAPGGRASDADLLAGSAGEVADHLEALRAVGVQGVRLRPAQNAVDLPLVRDALVPELVRRGLRLPDYRGETLREHLGLDRPANRFLDGRARAVRDRLVQPAL